MDDPKGKKKQSEQVSKRLIMRTGDKGKGVGSRTKGHLRYGGNWRQDNHTRYTPVCVTNEDCTSQTCVKASCGARTLILCCLASSVILPH